MLASARAGKHATVSTAMDTQVLARWLRGEQRTVAGELLRLLLLPFALVYGLCAWLKQALVRPQRLPVCVLSIGNLELGGTGKSVFVRWLAQRLESRGQRVLVVSRGYGAKVIAGIDEEGAELRAAGLRCAQGPKRHSVALEALRSAPADVVLLDDGAQHRRLHRDGEVLLFDAARPFGAGWPLPAGSLRGFVCAGPKPGLVVLTRTDEVQPEVLARTRERLERLYPKVPCVALRYRATALLPEGHIASLAGRKVFLLSGVARPASFRRLVEACGARVVGEHAAADHHAWNSAEVYQIAERAKDADADLLLTTGKDWSKVLDFRCQPPLGAVLIEAVLDVADTASVDEFCTGLLQSAAAGQPVTP